MTDMTEAQAAWSPPGDREDGYRCLGWTEDGWVCVTWLQMGLDAPEWFTDWYPDRNDKPTAFAPLPPLPPEFDALHERFQWKGEGPPPKSWEAKDEAGNPVNVYRSYRDYCDG